MKKNSRQSKTPKPSLLPSKEEILEFVNTSTGKVGKREIARAFNIKGGARIALKTLLRQMAEEGLLSGSRKNLTQPGKLPPVTILQITGQDSDGDYYAEPVKWDADEFGPPPKILIASFSKRQRATNNAGVGERVLARIEKSDLTDDETYTYVAKIIKRLARPSAEYLGIFRAHQNGGVIDPIDRQQLREWSVSEHEKADARDGELVRFQAHRTSRYGQGSAKIIECLGNPDEEKAISLIAIHRYAIPDRFPDAVMAELANLPNPDLSQREDLRNAPLITIDPSDARDHDDAVWAGPDKDDNNKGGFVIIVAIADVAFYVKPGSDLDREALKRGNSVYFPDRVVPMLPEEISNGLCSLKENEDRSCLAVRMIFDAEGRKKSHQFMRAVMRSHAKLSYEQAQRAIDGHLDEKTEPLRAQILQPLWKAYNVLKEARDKRGPLELDLPERKIRLNKEGKVADIVIPERLDAHKLIEEFMIQANVAAAETLEQKKVAAVYRVHDAPSKEKLTALADFLATLDVKLTKSGNLKPHHFNQILEQMRDGPHSDLVSEVVLRSQAQAEYTPYNAGHFGLNLNRYAHFTSPIRRYADLIVHRALIASLQLGKDGQVIDDQHQLEDIAKAISDTERRAMAAERETVDRLISAFLADRIGATFSARISGVTRSGLFVRLSETGADGFIPISTLGRGYYIYDDKRQALVEERSGEGYSLGDTVKVELVEAIASAGALRFKMLTEGRVLPKRLIHPATFKKRRVGAKKRPNFRRRR